MDLAELAVVLGLTVDEHSFESAHELIESVHHALEAFAVFEGVKWVREMFNQTEEAAIATSHLSQRLGIASDELQKLTYAATSNGASSEAFVGSMQRMSRGLEEARKKGTGPFVAGVHALGLSMSDPVLKSGDLADVTKRVADGFANAGPKVNKTSAAMQVFGKNGTVLLPMLNEGTEGIKKMGDELEELGGVTSEETIKAFEELEKTQIRLKTGWKALLTNAVTELLPAVQELTDQFLAWLKENRELIKLRLHQVFSTIVKVLRTMVTVIGYALAAFGWLVEHADLVKITILALVAALAIFKAEAIAAAVKVAAAWLLEFAPLIALVGLFVAIGLAIDDVLSYFEGDESVIGDFVDSFEGGWDTVWEGIKAAGQAVIDFFVSGFKGIAGDIKDVIMVVINFLWAGLKGIWDDIKAAANAIKRGLTGSIDVEGFLKDAYAGTQHTGGGGIPGPTSNSSVDTWAPNVQVAITIPPGQNAEETANKVKEAFHQLFADQVRGLAGVMGGRSTP